MRWTQQKEIDNIEMSPQSNKMQCKMRNRNLTRQNATMQYDFFFFSFLSLKENKRNK